MWQVATYGRTGFSTRIVYDRVVGLDLQKRCGFSLDFRFSSKIRMTRASGVEQFPRQVQSLFSHRAQLALKSFVDDHVLVP